MTPQTEPEQDHSWDEIPAFRRHLYFYLLLVLGTIAADSLLGTLQQSNGRLAFAPPPPPRMTSADVYPAPVPAPALSPTPSDAQ